MFVTNPSIFGSERFYEKNYSFPEDLITMTMVKYSVNTTSIRFK